MSEQPEGSDAVEVIGEGATGAALILCEHASHRIPADYDGLGLSDEAATSHAAWDPGARDLALHLMRRLDGTLVASTVSRLVYDCNRPPEAASAMPEKSELIEVPGNARLTQAQRDRRTEAVYRPFCAAVTAQIEARAARTQPTAIITVHSFTPVYYGQMRETEVGILHDADSALADAMLKAGAKLERRGLHRNRPYGPEDGVTHSLQIHGMANDLPNVMIEVRNDLLQTPAQIAAMGDELCAMITPALVHLGLQTQGAAHA
ncbi:Predicted N-formylglutamate amidohydrolase [Roseovarius nanhaiticus]|uniref:Predicted N-formylglutamate amidohydrolase n=1 Tax=Roseovarius nanhaiticus TaxID=573024 RepID=A0A1N7EQ35_9RHOB|nr:N-formylglutamate amidohydrolase [Roseovarius nanhaiticus]SEK69418.1 Predicted N-formylglutamate amidohydrolase [Roseovarius nanhaiticus]SIR90152.1 Predicted N-formylglutamate amidohydrolase [Roseovarius nanhaiticus]